MDDKQAKAAQSVACRALLIGSFIAPSFIPPASRTKYSRSLHYGLSHWIFFPIQQQCQPTLSLWKKKKMSGSYLISNSSVINLLWGCWTFFLFNLWTLVPSECNAMYSVGSENAECRRNYSYLIVVESCKKVFVLSSSLGWLTNFCNSGSSLTVKEVSKWFIEFFFFFFTKGYLKTVIYGFCYQFTKSFTPLAQCLWVSLSEFLFWILDKTFWYKSVFFY